MLKVWVVFYGCVILGILIMSNLRMLYINSVEHLLQLLMLCTLVQLFQNISSKDLYLYYHNYLNWALICHQVDCTDHNTSSILCLCDPFFSTFVQVIYVQSNDLLFQWSFIRLSEWSFMVALALFIYFQFQISEYKNLENTFSSILYAFSLCFKNVSLFHLILHC